MHLIELSVGEIVRVIGTFPLAWKVIAIRFGRVDLECINEDTRRLSAIPRQMVRKWPQILAERLSKGRKIE